MISDWDKVELNKPKNWEITYQDIIKKYTSKEEDDWFKTLLEKSDPKSLNKYDQSEKFYKYENRTELRGSKEEIKLDTGFMTPEPYNDYFVQTNEEPIVIQDDLKFSFL